LVRDGVEADVTCKGGDIGLRHTKISSRNFSRGNFQGLIGTGEWGDGVTLAGDLARGGGAVATEAMDGCVDWEEVSANWREEEGVT
jgi:hypothetical protein